MKLPKLTNKQQDIIELLYQYRFLNRIQIQSLMGHKDKKTINMWLRDLKAKQYIDWIYDPYNFALKTKPAIYYIAINGVRYLKTVKATDGTAWYPLDDVRKRYREASRSQSYIDHGILVADCCINLKVKTARTSEASADAKASDVAYSFVTLADYGHPYSDYHFLSDSELVQPDLCFVKQEHTRDTARDEGEDETNKNEALTTSNLLEIFDATLPRYRIKKRLSNYIEFIEQGEWESETGDDKPPIILLACQRTSDLIYAKRRTKGLLAERWDYGDDDRPQIGFATVEQLQANGMTGKIWEEA